MPHVSVFKKPSPWLFLLILAVIIGGFVRVWKISTLPFPPNGDELAYGYYGWSLLHFGTDEYGNRYPVYFPSGGDYKYPVLAYFNMLPAAIFGLTEVTTRFWSVVSGILLIPLVFVLTWLIVRSRSAGVAAAWLVAISPWGVSLARYGYETNLATLLIVSGFINLLLLEFVPRQRRRLGLVLYFLSFVLLVLALYTYGSARIFIPLMLAGLTTVSYLKKNRLYPFRRHFLALLIILTSLAAVSLIPWQSRGRATGVLALTQTPEQKKQLAIIAVEAGTAPMKPPIILTRIFHNRYEQVILSFLGRYARFFESEFLFFSAGTAVERIPGVGALLLVQIFLLPAGVIFLFADARRRPYYWLLLIWLAVSPIPSALTGGDPQLTRALVMLPALSAISGSGFMVILRLAPAIWRPMVVFGLAIFTAVNGVQVAYQLFVHKTMHEPWKNEQVAKKMTDLVSELKSQYQAVAIPGDDYIYFLFYQHVSPAEFVSRSTIRPEAYGNQWERVERLDNIVFRMPYDCPREGKMHVLYVCQGPNIPQNTHLLADLHYRDEVPAYTLLEFAGPLVKRATLPLLPKRLHYMVDADTRFVGGIIPADRPDLW
jgi:4-amino-4-deoxy-L-arabinose transferase-like glycosyltransferase